MRTPRNSIAIRPLLGQAGKAKWTRLRSSGTSIGVIFQVLAVAFFAYNVLRSLFKGKPAGDDPWDAWTLEWSTTSPPPAWNYNVDPEVRSRRPLWDRKHPEDPDWKYE